MAGRNTVNVVDIVCLWTKSHYCHSMERFAGQDGLTILERMGGMMESKILETAKRADFPRSS